MINKEMLDNINLFLKDVVDYASGTSNRYILEISLNKFIKSIDSRLSYDWKDVYPVVVEAPQSIDPSTAKLFVEAGIILGKANPHKSTKQLVNTIFEMINSVQEMDIKSYEVPEC